MYKLMFGAENLVIRQKTALQNITTTDYLNKENLIKDEEMNTEPNIALDTQNLLINANKLQSATTIVSKGFSNTQLNSEGLNV